MIFQPASFSILNDGAFFERDQKMRVSTDNSVKKNEKTLGAGRAKRASGAGAVFSVGAAGGAIDAIDDLADTDGSSELAGGIATSGIGSLLSLQEVQFNEQQDQGALDYGKGLITQLRQLQSELLRGDIEITRLNAMQYFINSNRGKASNSLALQGIIAQIETRVAVEMAKYGQDIGLANKHI